MVQGSNTWAVDNEIEAITTAEVLERHDALVLVAVEDHEEMVRPLEREWRMGAQADVLSCRNVAGVRTPPRTGASESDYEAAKRDLTRSLTRLPVPPPVCNVPPVPPPVYLFPCATSRTVLPLSLLRLAC